MSLFTGSILNTPQFTAQLMEVCPDAGALLFEKSDFPAHTPQWHHVTFRKYWLTTRPTFRVEAAKE